MAKSEPVTCKCGGEFNVVHQDVQSREHSAYHVGFVRCVSCGSVAGVLDGWLAARVEALEESLKRGSG